SIATVVPHLVKNSLIFLHALLIHLRSSSTEREWTYGPRIISVDGLFCTFLSYVSQLLRPNLFPENMIKTH
ncbi:hypothetical protein MTR67_030990, partial [Solanum verrucosum]